MLLRLRQWRAVRTQVGWRRLDERRRLRVERYLLTLRRHGHQPQLEDSTMTTETEALRAGAKEPSDG